MEDDYDLGALKKPKRKNSRAKGSTFERGVSKQLNERFNVKVFSRTPGSGAYATTHNLPEHLQIHGDIITPQEFKYTLELKKGYNDVSLYNLYDYSSTFWNFWAQAEKDAGKSRKAPMLIFKQDRKPTLAMVHASAGFTSTKFIQLHKDDELLNLYFFDDILQEDTSLWFG